MVVQLLEQLAVSFVACAAFSLIFGVQKHRLVQCGLVGASGWLTYTVCSAFEMRTIPATLLAVCVVTIISQIMAKHYRTPIIVFSAAGIIPLVPGKIAYDAMRHIVQEEYVVAVELAMQAFMISGSIAIGLVFSEVIYIIFRRTPRSS